MKKKVLSGILAFALLFGSAAALPESVVTDSTSITASAASTATSGKCGKNVSWSLKNGVLTISGTGKMTDFDYESSPFFDRTDIKSVVIKSGVTSVGSYAFRNCTSLKIVTIPSSVTSISEHAFAGCTRLESVTIPNSVTSIGDGAFMESKWLDNQQKKNPLVIVNGILIDGKKCNGKVTIPSNVTSISGGAFYGCTSLKSITIPNSVTSIGDWAFYECTSLTSVTIPSGVTRIGSETFDGCKSLANVTIPSSVTSIGGFAFNGCTSLKSITIPNSVTSIGEYAFNWCNATSVIIPRSVTSIGEFAFGYHWFGPKIDGFTIYGYKGSAAEQYAKLYDFKFVARSTTQPKTVRFAGSDRAETATLIANANKGGSHKTADTVVIATGFDFHDALAAVPLASAYNAPLLLADRDNLSTKTLAEIKRLEAKNAIVVASTNAKDQNGKSAAIGKNVYKQLKGYKVTKIVGSSYYETTKKVAQQLQKKTGKAPSYVFITTVNNYADALSVSPVAAALKAPIMYVDPKAKPNANTTYYLNSVKSSLNKIFIIGGVNAVSKDVVSKIKAVVPNKTVQRFAGNDRYETCIRINKAFASTLTGNAVCVAKGYNFPDALAGGVFAAKNKAPLFLADKLGNKAELSKKQADYLFEKNPTKLYIFGGKTAIPTDLVKTISIACV